MPGGPKQRGPLAFRVGSLSGARQFRMLCLIDEHQPQAEPPHVSDSTNPSSKGSCVSILSVSSP